MIEGVLYVPVLVAVYTQDEDEARKRADSLCETVHGETFHLVGTRNDPEPVCYPGEESCIFVDIPAGWDAVAV